MSSTPRTGSAQRFLRALSAALQTYTLYPTGHPKRTEGLKEILEPAREMIGHDASPPILFVARGSFYINDALLPRESLSLERLRKHLEEAGIEALEILPGIDEDAVDGLIRRLLGDAGEPPSARGIAVNRVKPQLGDHPERVLDATELFRTYASGLELLRQTSMTAATSETIDIESTTALVEGIADQVSQNPAQALLVTTIKSYDEYLYYHMTNVCLLSIALGYAIGLSRDQVVMLGVGGLLHDIGKVKVPLEVLQFPGRLNEEQWRLIQKHPQDGAGLFYTATNDLRHPAISIVLEHHSAFDLSGYPKLSNRWQPSLPARLVAVTDCFDAITTKRSYRQADNRRKALDILEAGAGKGFDARIVRALVRMLGVYPVGSFVQLNSGETALVVKNHEDLLARPVVRLLLDAQGSPCDPEELDLSVDAANGSGQRKVSRSMDADELDVDMEVLLRTGSLVEPDEPAEQEPGLVHEPAFGETPPEGYVDTYNDPGPAPPQP